MKHYYGKFRQLLLWVCAIFIANSAIAQKLTVSGVVTDSTDGSTLPGVNVIVKGSPAGTITDFDGKYTINAEQGATLLFSFVGYNPKELVVSGAVLNVTLGVDTKSLDEVVVIGYGSVKKDDATGSVTAISADDFNGGVVTSPQDLIVGKSAGIQITSDGGAPGAGSTIRIRGGASLKANNDPLIVIDGVPLESKGINGMSNPLATINPKDIETFTVLKDASATAIYGSRASNGVIIITTKQGKAGSKLKVDYSGKFSVGTPSNQLDVYNAAAYKQLIEDRYGKESDAYNALGDADTDWQDQIYQTALGTDHSIGLSGGIKNLPYRLSLGYNNQEGTLKTSKIERYSLNLNLNPSFFDGDLKTNVSFKGSMVNNRFADDGIIGSAVNFDPTHPVYSDDQTWGGYYTWVNEENLPIAFSPNNPLAMLEQVNDESTVYRGILNFSLDYAIPVVPGLSAKLNMAIDHSQSDGFDITSPYAAWAYKYDASRVEFEEQIRGEKRDYDQEKNNMLLDFYMNYTHDFGEHNINAMAGYSWQKFDESGGEETWDYFKINSKGNVPFASEYFLVSFFGRANYSYKNRYLLTGTVRRDGTSRFNPDGGNQWGVFPSAAFAWKIKDESFLADIDVLSDLKLRVGWGITGQQDVSGSAYVGYSTYKQSNQGASYIFGDTWFDTYRPAGVDPNLKWEETTSTNIGLDFAFVNERISGSVDYYKKTTDDLINEITVAAGTNLSDKIVSNVGSLVNEGVEINLLVRPISKRNLYWEVGANLTLNRNEITKLTAVDDPAYPGVPTGDIGSGRNVQIHALGQPASSFYVYEQLYRDGQPLDGEYVDQNSDGLINDKDKIIYGNPSPDALIGLNTTLRYKNWDLSVSGRFQLGAEIYNSIKEGNSNWYNLYNPTTQSLGNRLTVANEIQFTTTDEQRVFSSHWIEEANFFRLDNLTVGYNFESVLGSETTNLRLYLTGQNLLLISKYDGLDPEVFNGIDRDMYPRPTTVVFGLNLGF